MDNETFEIFLVTYIDGKKHLYRLQVEVLQKSEQVVRFKIFAGEKNMIMEKLMTKHTGQWKIKEMNFEMTGNIKDNAQNIMKIQDELDYYLAGRPKPVNKFRNKP